MERPELTILRRPVASVRRPTVAVAKVGYDGFLGDFAAGASQAYDRHHQSTLLPEPKQCSLTCTAGSGARQPPCRIVSIPGDVHWRDALKMPRKNVNSLLLINFDCLAR
jgi:hypothetical protein